MCKVSCFSDRYSKYSKQQLFKDISDIDQLSDVLRYACTSNTSTYRGSSLYLQCKGCVVRYFSKKTSVLLKKKLYFFADSRWVMWDITWLLPWLQQSRMQFSNNMVLQTGSESYWIFNAEELKGQIQWSVVCHGFIGGRAYGTYFLSRTWEIYDIVL